MKKEQFGSIYNWISTFILIAWGLFLIQTLVWYYYPVNVIDHFCLPAKVLNQDKQVKRGEYLEFELDFEKYQDFPAQISRSLVNDRIVTLTCETGAMMPNGRKKTIVRVFIPLNVWPGKYQLVTDITYRVNPLREEHEKYETEWFEVIE